MIIQIPHGSDAAAEKTAAAPLMKLISE